MSRSRKKTPIYKYAPSSRRGGSKKVKREANRKVRKTLFLKNGMIYKRCYPQWGIHDVVDRYTWKDHVERAYQRRNSFFFTYFGSNLDIDFQFWAKYFLRK